MKVRRVLQLVFGFAAWGLIIATGIELENGGYYPMFGATLICAGGCGVIAWLLGTI